MNPSNPGSMDPSERQAAAPSPVPNSLPPAATGTDPAYVKGLFSAIASRYDLANHLLSGGIDFWWRRRLGKMVAELQPQSILDLATGSGDIAITLGRYCPNAKIFGADFCHPMLLQAAAKGVKDLATADGLRLPFASASFDVVTIAFGLRNMQSRSQGLREMCRVLKPRGHLFVLDFSIPASPLRGLYRVYLHRVLPAIAGVVTGEKEAYSYLGDSIEKFPQGEAMLEKMRSCGFAQAEANPLTAGIVTLYCAKRG